MPRQPRAVFANIPHHVTQRGNRQGDVFFSDQDRLFYLECLQDYCNKHRVDIIAYCLMSNHIHLIAMPQTSEGLQLVLRPLHTRYAQRINRSHGWKGHLWQGRFFSSPLDDPYLWAAVRYVERNPVRAGMVERAEEYQWSSAAAHCDLRRDGLLGKDEVGKKILASVGNWSGWLKSEDDAGRIAHLRRNIERSLPCGTDEFVQILSNKIGRALDCRPQGRPLK